MHMMASMLMRVAVAAVARLVPVAGPALAAAG